MKIYDELYTFSIFDKIIESIYYTVENPEKHFFKDSFASRPISLKQMLKFTEEEKKDFVKNIVLIHGNLDKCTLSSVQYKNCQSRAGFRDLTLNLNFSESDIQKYLAFHRSIIGLYAYDEIA